MDLTFVLLAQLSHTPAKTEGLWAMVPILAVAAIIVGTLILKNRSFKKKSEAHRRIVLDCVRRLNEQGTDAKVCLECHGSGRLLTTRLLTWTRGSPAMVEVTCPHCHGVGYLYSPSASPDPGPEDPPPQDPGVN